MGALTQYLKEGEKVLLATVVKVCTLHLTRVPLLSYTLPQLVSALLSCFNFMNFINLTNYINLHTLRHNSSPNNLFSFRFINFLLGEQGKVEKSLLLYSSQKKFYFLKQIIV